MLLLCARKVLHVFDSTDHNSCWLWVDPAFDHIPAQRATRSFSRRRQPHLVGSWDLNGSVIGQLFNHSQIEGKPSSTPGDVYAFGLICWELLSMKLPFTEYARLSEIETAVMSGIRPPIPGEPRSPTLFHELILACWEGEASARPSMTEAFEAWKSVPSSAHRVAIHCASPNWNCTRFYG